MRHRIAALAATTVIAAGGALVNATSASATTDPPPGGGTWDHTWTTTDAAHGGTVYIEEYGDIVKLCDTAADGHYPRVDIGLATNAGYMALYTLTAKGGVGSCVTASASQGGEYNLPENGLILVDIYLSDYSGDAQHSYLNDH